MNRILTVVMSMFVATSVCCADEKKPMTVPDVKYVEFDVLKTNPPTLLVKVTGEVRSLGFTNPELTRATYVAPPKDGVQDYTLTAVPPKEAAGQAITEVSAEDAWKNFAKDAPWLKGIRIKGIGTGVKLVWIKADVTITNHQNKAKAKVGQIVEIQIEYGVFPPFPSDYEVIIGGKVIPHSEMPGAVFINGQAVVGASMNCLRFPIVTEGKQLVTVNFKRGKQKTTSEVEIEVIK